MDYEMEYERYENDLQDFSDREAWEDGQADMRSMQAEDDEGRDYGECRWCEYVGELENGLCPECVREIEDDIEDYHEGMEDAMVDISHEAQCEMYG